MSQDKTGVIAWLRQWLDDIYAPKGQGGGITFDDVYPVGAIYMSVNSVNPSELFGGTWEQIQDKFLLASSTTHALGSTGGEETHKLTVDEMPSHTHIQNQHRHGLGSDWSSGTGSTGAYVHSSNRKTTTKYSDYTTPTNQNTGGGQAHNNMPPYLVVNIWKRTA